MLVELKGLGLKCEKQKQILVNYKGFNVGEYYSDIIVYDCIILELKAAEALCREHEIQLVNYLKATEIEVGLLFNFGHKPEFKRKVLTKEYKNILS